MTSLHVIEEGRRAKPPVSEDRLDHRDLLDGEFWRRIPAYKDVDKDTFLDHRWQSKKTIRKADKLLETLAGIAPQGFISDAQKGFAQAPMAVRVSPYLLSIIDWDNPIDDPQRIQFIPLGSKFLPDHPKLGLDSLAEQEDAPVAGLTHRYEDKALFLAIDTCPVYCRFCTRSYAVGLDTEQVAKISLKANRDRWSRMFEYVASRPELEDIVISGGDAYNLRSDMIREIASTLLHMPNIRRIRFASKGLAVMPQKFSLTMIGFAQLWICINWDGVWVKKLRFIRTSTMRAKSRPCLDKPLIVFSRKASLFETNLFS